MINRSFTLYAFVLSCGLLFSVLLTSCDSTSDKSGKADTTNVETPGSTTATLGANPSIPLYSLTVTDAFFQDNNNKDKNIFFSYFITESHVTLYGWGLKKLGLGGSGTFNSTPDLRLNVNEKIDEVAIGPDTFVGTQVILKGDVQKIHRLVKNKTTVLHFTPMRVPAIGGTGFAINYRISIQHLSRMGSQFLPETFDTNPSPPHQAYD